MYIIDLMNTGNADFISKQVEIGEYYYLNLTPKNMKTDAVICGGREQCTPDYHIKRKGFRFCSIEFVSAGKGTVKQFEKSHPLRPGALFFYGPDIPHTIETDPDTPLLKHFVDFVGTGLTQQIRATALPHTPLYTNSLFRMRSLFESMLQTGCTESRHREKLCRLILQQIILTVDETALPHQEAFSPAWQTYLRCRQHIEQNFPTIGNIEQAALECHLDKAYLCRLFTRYADETPLQLLNRLKMGQAAKLLSAHGLLVKEAADQCGYADPFHFSRVFKRVYGIPPDTFLKTTQRSGSDA